MRKFFSLFTPSPQTSQAGKEKSYEEMSAEELVTLLRATVPGLEKYSDSVLCQYYCASNSNSLRPYPKGVDPDFLFRNLIGNPNPKVFDIYQALGEKCRPTLHDEMICLADKLHRYGLK